MTQKSGKIIFVADPRLSRQKEIGLLRTVNALRHIADIELVHGNIKEDEFLVQLKDSVPDLVFLPWYRYLAWKKVEGFFGLTRNKGPTCVGYHLGRLLPYELGDQSNFLRAILVDMQNNSTAEVTKFVQMLIEDRKRAGLMPFFERNVKIYCEDWSNQQGLGTRVDSVLALPEIRQRAWIERAGAIRITLGALWSLIYEEGPGKAEFRQNIVSFKPRARFQVAASDNFLTLKLNYVMSNWSPKNVVQFFWPNEGRPTSCSQLLLRYTDFLRIHRVTESGEIEVVAGFCKSAGAERHPEQIHTLWIEPISDLMLPEDEPSRLHPLPMPEQPETKTLIAQPSARELDLQARLATAASQIRGLKQELAEREHFIHELQIGGVGTSNETLVMPEAESLLEAFQEHYFRATFEIRDCERQIDALQSRGGTLPRVQGLKKKMQDLADRQSNWIKTIADFLQEYSNERQRRKRSAGQ